MEINLNEISFAYENKTVLDKVTMKINSGKITGILGKSGSGKTTLLELMDALLLPNQGTIQVGEISFSKDKKLENKNLFRSQVGFLFQFPEQQFFNSTVFEEIAVSLSFFHYPEEEKKQMVKDVLVKVGLSEDYLEKNPFTLSNGEKRKVALACALVHNPTVLLLDEPTIGLDSRSKKEMIRLLTTLKKQYGKTIVIATHDMDFIHKLADFIYIIDQQKILTEGDKYTVFKQVSFLREYALDVPKVIEFSDQVQKQKNIKIGYRDDINDLIKDIYRYAK